MKTALVASQAITSCRGSSICEDSLSRGTLLRDLLGSLSALRLPKPCSWVICCLCTCRRTFPRMDQLLVFSTSSSTGALMSVVMMPFSAPVSRSLRVISRVSTSAMPAHASTCKYGIEQKGGMSTLLPLSVKQGWCLAGSDLLWERGWFGRSVTPSTFCSFRYWSKDFVDL